MMIHMSVPKYLWSDVVLSAYHLLNRMPSSILDKKNSHSLVFILTKHHSPWLPMFLAALILFRTCLLG